VYRVHSWIYSRAGILLFTFNKLNKISLSIYIFLLLFFSFFLLFSLLGEDHAQEYKFDSKVSEDMYEALDQVGQEQQAQATSRRSARVMDPYGPFRGKLTRERVQSLCSNI
jgi:uncharacterized membrane protein YeiB